MNLRDFIIREKLPAPAFVKFIDEDNFSLAYKERADAETLWKAYAKHNKEILNIAQYPETLYWHITKGTI